MRAERLSYTYRDNKKRGKNKFVNPRTQIRKKNRSSYPALKCKCKSKMNPLERKKEKDKSTALNKLIEGKKRESSYIQEILNK